MKESDYCRVTEITNLRRAIDCLRAISSRNQKREEAIRRIEGELYQMTEDIYHKEIDGKIKT